MTNNSKKYMSAFALSAAALLLGACNKGGAETQEPDAAAEAPADGADAAPADGAADVAAAADEDVKCFGINSCKGESVCAVNKPELGIEHACAGENECKGKGWIKVTRADCETQEGEVLGVL